MYNSSRSAAHVVGLSSVQGWSPVPPPGGLVTVPGKEAHLGGFFYIWCPSFRAVRAGHARWSFLVFIAVKKVPLMETRQRLHTAILDSLRSFPHVIVLAATREFGACLSRLSERFSEQLPRG